MDFNQLQSEHLPPQPSIESVTFLSDTKVLIVWSMNDLTEEMTKIDRYEIYVIDVEHCGTECNNWQLIAEIQASPSPISVGVVMINSFESKDRQNYFFLIRAIDVCGCCGLLSIPKADMQC